MKIDWRVRHGTDPLLPAHVVMKATNPTGRFVEIIIFEISTLMAFPEIRKIYREEARRVLSRAA